MYLHIGLFLITVELHVPALVLEIYCSGWSPYFGLQHEGN